MPNTRSTPPRSTPPTWRLRWPRRSSPKPAMVDTACGVAGSPSPAPVPALSTCTPSMPRCATRPRSSVASIGLRQVLPVQTHKIFMGQPSGSPEVRRSGSRKAKRLSDAGDLLARWTSGLPDLRTSGPASLRLPRFPTLPDVFPVMFAVEADRLARGVGGGARRIQVGAQAAYRQHAAAGGHHLAALVAGSGVEHRRGLRLRAVEAADGQV